MNLHWPPRPHRRTSVQIAQDTGFQQPEGSAMLESVGEGRLGRMCLLCRLRRKAVPCLSEWATSPTPPLNPPLSPPLKEPDVSSPVRVRSPGRVQQVGEPDHAAGQGSGDSQLASWDVPQQPLIGIIVPPPPPPYTVSIKGGTSQLTPAAPKLYDAHVSSCSEVRWYPE